MKISLVFMTYNRLDYTKLALKSLLADPSEEFALTIWDNASTDGTQDYLKTVKDRRIVDVVFSDQNKGQTYVTNKVWNATSAQLVGKVDNDCLVTPGWTRILTQAHKDLQNLGVVGCWHFSPDEFCYERAKHKIQTFGKHQIFRHPWVDGSALLLKRTTFMECGPCKEDEYLTKFWLRLALKGYVNGYYYPLIYQVHMDYPWSKYYAFSDKHQKGFEMSATGSHIGIRTLEEAKAWHQVVVSTVLDEPWDAKYYVGWRGKLRRAKAKLRRILKNSAF